MDNNQTATKKESPAFKYLTSSIQIGPVALENRMAVAPMQTFMSGSTGEIGEQCLSYVAARAKGGAGLVISGVFIGTKLASRFTLGRPMFLFHEGHQYSAARYAEHIHYFGSVACAQMSPGMGRQCAPWDPEAIAPAPTANLPYEAAREKMFDALSATVSMDERARMVTRGPMTRELGIEEIRHEQIEFANSCQLAVLAGFDMIEIHATHGFLCHQFLSPLSNKRTDLYGGEWRNRKRFLNELMEIVRYACQGVAVGVRISAEEHMEGGLSRQEMVDLAKDLEARGADFLHLSDGGGIEECGHQIPDADRAVHMADHGTDFKRELTIPVMVMSQHDPVQADADIGAGKYDISALGRALLCDPEYPNKIRAGQPEDIVKCIRCNTCILRGLAGMYLACPLNPNLGREYLMDQYRLGPWKKEENLIPKSWATARLKPLYKKPMWRDTIELVEKCWRPFRGPGPR